MCAGGWGSGWRASSSPPASAYRRLALEKLGGKEDAGERNELRLIALNGGLAPRGEVAVKVVDGGPRGLGRQAVVVAHLSGVRRAAHGRSGGCGAQGSDELRGASAPESWGGVWARAARRGVGPSGEGVGGARDPRGSSARAHMPTGRGDSSGLVPRRSPLQCTGQCNPSGGRRGRVCVGLLRRRRPTGAPACPVLPSRPAVVPRPGP